MAMDLALDALAKRSHASQAIHVRLSIRNGEASTMTGVLPVG